MTENQFRSGGHGSVDGAAKRTYKVKPAKVLPFNRLPDAHRLIESYQANAHFTKGG
jgi:hypothetical protein